MRNVPNASPVRRASHRHQPGRHVVLRAVAWIALVLASADHAARQPGKDPLASKVEFLPVDEAFVLSAQHTDRQLVVRWDMPDGYYLYRHAFSVEAAGLGQPVIPAGQPKVDEYFGDSEVYYGQVEVTVPTHAPTTRPVRAHVTYQGCADYGLCYPPQRRLIALAADGSLEITRLQANAKSDVR